MMYKALFFLALPFKLYVDVASYLYGFVFFGIGYYLSLVVSFCLIIFLLVFNKLRRVDDRTLLGVISLFFIVTLSYFYQSIFGVKSGNFFEGMISYFTFVPLCFFYFCSGFGFRENLDYNWLFSYWFLSIGIILPYQIFSDIWLTLNENGAYLRISDCLSVLTLFLMSHEKTSRTRFTFIFMMTMLTLFFLGSRSSLATFFVASVLYFTFNHLKATLDKCLTMFFLLSLFVFAIHLNLLEYILDSDFRVVTSIQSNTLGGGDIRLSYFLNGIDRISDSPINGNLYERIDQTPYPGDYIHNIFFIYDDFGLIPFIVTLYLIFNITKYVFNKKNRRFLGVFAFCLLSMIIARAYSFPYVYMILGMMAIKFKSLNKEEIR